MENNVILEVHVHGDTWPRTVFTDLTLLSEVVKGLPSPTHEYMQLCLTFPEMLENSGNL